MIFFFLTNITLDIFWGVTYWIVKKTKNGVEYILYPNSQKKIKDNSEQLLLEIQKQNIEIARLSNKIEAIDGYIKTLN